MRQRGFTPLLMMLTLMGIGLIAYFGYFYRFSTQPTTEQETYCKEYLNSEFGFSFNCPGASNLQIFEWKKNGDKYIYGAESEVLAALPNSDHIYMEIFIYKSSLSPDEWWKKIGLSIFEENYDKVVIDNSSASIIDNQPAIKLMGRKWDEQGEPCVKDYPCAINMQIVSKNGWVYMIFQPGGNLAYQFPSEKEKVEIGEQLLSSFKFTQ